MLDSIKQKSKQIFDSNKKIYTDFIKETLNDFVVDQTERILQLLTLGHSTARILDYFDETRVTELAQRIYDHLDREVRNSIKVVWTLNSGRLVATAQAVRGNVDQKQVRSLTEKCVQRYSWSILEPFVRDVVRDLFFESFREGARRQIPGWIGLASSREVTRSLKQVGHILPDALTQDIYSEDFMFGATPIAQAINLASLRFLDKSYRRRDKVLIIVSDGEFKSNAPTVSAQLLKRSGVTVVCCCVTDRNIMTKLLRKQPRKWPQGAQRLFEMASTVDSRDRWVQAVKAKGYEVPEGVKR